MSRKLIVEIIGDASSLQRSFQTAGAETESFGSKLGLTKAGLIGVAAAAGGFAVEIGVKSVEAAIKGQAAQAALDQALRTTHQSVKAMTPALEEAEAASRKLGFADEDSRASLSRLEIATGDTTKAVSDLSVAEDLARVKHVDLATATNAIAMAMTGSQRALKQLGISIAPVTNAYDKLRATMKGHLTEQDKEALSAAKLADKQRTAAEVIQVVTEKVHGQAQAFSETAAGSMARFHAEVQHLEEALGTALLPALTKVANELSNVSVWLDKNKNAVHAFEEAVKLAADGIKVQINGIELAYKTLEIIVENVVKGAIAATDLFLAGLQRLFEAATHIPFVGDKFKGVASAIGDARSQLHALQSDIDALHGKTVDITTRNIVIGDDFHHRALGGRVTAGVPYIVGEDRPELFVPDQSGTILPRVPASTNGNNGSGGVTVIVNGDVTGDEIVNKVRQGLEQLVRTGANLRFA